MRAQSSLEHTEPGGGGGPTLACYSNSCVLLRIVLYKQNVHYSPST